VLVGRQLAHLVDEALVVLQLLAVVADQVGRLLDVAKGLQPVLADLHGHEGGQLVGALADEVGGPARHGHPLRPGRVRPRREGGLGGGDGVVDVTLGGRVDGGQLQLVVVGAAKGEGLAVGAGLAVDHRGDGLADPGPGRAHALLEGGVELLVVGREGGVGDTELRHWGLPSLERAPCRWSC
jgi:hypothetical protein